MTNFLHFVYVSPSENTDFPPLGPKNALLTRRPDRSTVLPMTTRNVTKAFRLSTAQDREDGLHWYDYARDYAASLDSDIPRAAGILAALSPQQSWPVNKRMAAEFYAGRRNVHTSDNVAKALAILDGAEPLSVLGGPKVRAFYTNIMGMDTTEAVTIDRHAIMVCEGRVIAGDALKAYFGTRRNRQYVSEYVSAAKILSKETGTYMTPAQIQAITWVWWRRNHAIAKHGD